MNNPEVTVAGKIFIRQHDEENLIGKREPDWVTPDSVIMSHYSSTAVL